jgi:hypothetical protein
MPFVPNLSTPYLESALELCFGDADDDARARQDLLSQYSGVYAEIGLSLYAEWLELLQRADSIEPELCTRLTHGLERCGAQATWNP